MYRSSNSSDFNPMEHIWDVSSKLKPPYPNIPDLRERYINMRYNLSPAIYQRLVTSISWRTATVFLLWRNIKMFMYKTPVDSGGDLAMKIVQ